jgi:hypothetical protein
VVFLAIEQKEPHPGHLAFEDIRQPATYEERRALAVRCRDELEIPFTFLVDGMDDPSRALFGDLPSPAFVVNRDGQIADKLAWADPDEIGRSLKGLERAAELRAAAEHHGWKPLDLIDCIASCRAKLRSKDVRAAREALEDALKAAKDLPADVAAEAHLALAAARRAEGDAKAAAAAAAAAEESAKKAWSANPARLVAALSELAELEPPGPAAKARWTAALAVLEKRASASQRAWLEARVAAAR